MHGWLCVVTGLQSLPNTAAGARVQVEVFEACGMISCRRQKDVSGEPGRSAGGIAGRGEVSKCD